MFDHTHHGMVRVSAHAFLFRYRPSSAIQQQKPILSRYQQNISTQNLRNIRKALQNDSDTVGIPSASVQKSRPTSSAHSALEALICSAIRPAHTLPSPLLRAHLQAASSAVVPSPSRTSAWALAASSNRNTSGRPSLAARQALVAPLLSRLSRSVARVCV